MIASNLPDRVCQLVTALVEDLGWNIIRTGGGIDVNFFDGTDDIVAGEVYLL